MLSHFCIGTTRKGCPCQNHVTPQQNYCHLHRKQVGRGKEQIVTLRKAAYPKSGQKVEPAVREVAANPELLRHIGSYLRKKILFQNVTFHKGNIGLRITQLIPGKPKMIWEGYLGSAEYIARNSAQMVIIDVDFPIQISFYRWNFIEQNYGGSVIIAPDQLERTQKIKIRGDPELKVELDDHTVIDVH